MHKMGMNQRAYSMHSDKNKQYEQEIEKKIKLIRENSEFMLKKESIYLTEITQTSRSQRHRHYWMTT